eukprot:UN05033
MKQRLNMARLRLVPVRTFIQTPWFQMCQWMTMLAKDTSQTCWVHTQPHLQWLLNSRQPQENPSLRSAGLVRFVSRRASSSSATTVSPATRAAGPCRRTESSTCSFLSPWRTTCQRSPLLSTTSQLLHG